MISLEELKRLHEGATQGKWYDDGYRVYAPTVKEDKRDGPVLWEYKYADDDPAKGHYENAALICYLRNHCEDIIKILEVRND